MTDGPVAAGPAGSPHAEPPPPPRSVHLLMVHGVGRHDPLSSLLEVYQSFRSNLRSTEAPVLFEDRIPDWRLDEVEEGSAPAYLKLVPRFPDQTEGVKAVYLYEVNYSTLAGLVRHNHPLDLTTLFVGFDMAVCAARLKLPPGLTATLGGGRAGELAVGLQRLSGVLTAATVPLLGLPSMLLRRYTETFVAAFTRFFEDVATFALDKNGEQLIAAHIDRTVDNIVRSRQFTRAESPGELVVAAHSLGSVVVHNFLVRHWTSNPLYVPRRLVTFGSPIGFIAWLWLFLDFPAFDFAANSPTGRNYFCWSTASNAGRTTTPLTWINVVNFGDPIATAFPTQAADLSRPVAEVAACVNGGGIIHRYCGTPKLASVGASHTQYLHDRTGFVEILLRAAELRPGEPADVKTVPAEAHWAATLRVLARWQRILWLIALVAAAAYCGFVANRLDDWRLMLMVPVFMWPEATIGGVAFFQRFFFGGPTKRIPGERIDNFSWRDGPSTPYLLRRTLAALFRASRDVDPELPSERMRRYILKVLSFVPTMVAMSAPFAAGRMLGHDAPWLWQTPGWYLTATLIFTIYLVACAVFELVAGWRAILVEIGVAPTPASAPNAVPS